MVVKNFDFSVFWSGGRDGGISAPSPPSRSQSQSQSQSLSLSLSSSLSLSVTKIKNLYPLRARGEPDFLNTLSMDLYGYSYISSKRIPFYFDFFDFRIKFQDWDLYGELTLYC